VQLSPADAVATIWNHVERYYSVEVDAFVAMPNHRHGILVLGEPAKADRDGATVPTTAAGTVELERNYERSRHGNRNCVGSGTE
jgi:hypothetical protein